MSAGGRPYPLLACGDTCEGPKYTTRDSVKCHGSIDDYIRIQNRFCSIPY